MISTLAGAVGSAVLLGIAAGVADRRIFAATLAYCVCLLAMLVCSAAYNLAADGSRRRFLRRLDHAAIFLMIAGTMRWHSLVLSAASCHYAAILHGVVLARS